MRLLKNVLDFYIRSSLHVAVCFVALLYMVSVTGTFFATYSLYIVSFCSILVGYNLMKYVELIVKRKPFRFKSIIIISSLTAAITGIGFLALENYKVWLVFLLLVLVSMFYAIPLFYHRSWRQYPYLKVLSVVMCWMLLLYAYPYFSSFSLEAIFTDAYNFNKRIFYTEIGTMFLFIYGLCIPFEIRDLKYDAIQLQTIPQKIGVKKTKILGVIILISALIIHHLGDYHSYFNPDLELDYIFTTIVIITVAAIWFSDTFKSDYYASFFVEAIPVLWLGLYLYF